MATVVITQSGAIEEAVAEALRHLPLEPLVRGKRMAVKPNDTWASAEDTTGVTQPDTLRAVLRHLRQFGPRDLVVSGGAGAAETEDVFRVAGLMDVVEQEGAVSFDHNRPPFTPVELDYAPAADVVGANLLGFGLQAVRHLWEAGRLGLGETDVENMEFPALSLKQAIEAFTAAAYGERLTFEHG